MLFIYRLAVRAYGLVLQLAASFHPKARLWVEGRKGVFAALEKALPPGPPVIWFHVASLGEFEQGKPLMERMRQAYPDYRLLVTFFSPSGYEQRKNYEGADYVCYLPLDSPYHAARFVRLLKPVVAVFVKYEFWYDYLRELRAASIPTYFVAAQFRPSQLFFKPYGGWFLGQLKYVTHFFVQTPESSELLRAHGVNQVTVSGDTRIDRVSQTAAAQEPVEPVVGFGNGELVLVAGSSWPKEEELILEWLRDPEVTARCIIAPHEMHEDRMRKLEAEAPGPVARYFQSTPEEIAQARVIIVDGIGLLSRLYQHGHIALVGGGFYRKGLHNILEAATFGLPVIFGPNYDKNPEASSLIDEGGAFSVADAEAFKTVMKRLTTDQELREAAGQSAAGYIRKHRGATDLIFEAIEPVLNDQQPTV